MSERAKTADPAEVPYQSMMSALPHPVIMVDRDSFVVAANDMAQFFFQSSAAYLAKHKLSDLLPFGSPVLALVEQARDRLAPVNEYRVRYFQSPHWR